jgi:hypothetical protein
MSTKYMEELDKFTKETSENTSNAVSHLNLVEVIFFIIKTLARDVDKNLQDYHKLVELFRQ